MIECVDLKKIYRKRHSEVRALDGVQLRVQRGEFVVIRGPSGSGKSTLLLAVGGMLRPSSGTLRVAGRDLKGMGERQLARFRSEHIGFVFQMFHLIPYLPVVENVLLAAGAGRRNPGKERALKLLERLGMSHRLSHRPAELSAGEQQRVAIARALFNGPQLLLADEPTGNLDPDHAKEVMDHLSAFNENGGTVLLVTHGEDTAGYGTRLVRLQEGKMIPSK